MQSKRLSGMALAAPPDRAARGLSRCLACHHENKGGERICEVCSSSLNLKLCGACDAVNGDAVERCYSCGAALGIGGSSDAVAANTAPFNARGPRLSWALSLVALVAAAGVGVPEFLAAGRGGWPHYHWWVRPPAG
jgi:hypothetical protein